MIKNISLTRYLLIQVRLEEIRCVFRMIWVFNNLNQWSIQDGVLLQLEKTNNDKKAVKR